MIKRYLLAVPGLLLCLSACTGTGSKDSEKVADSSNTQKADSSKALDTIKDDSKFVVKATSGVKMETQLGAYAAKNAVTPGVKAFGERMLKDHGKDNANLEQLASAKHITIPARTGEDFQKHIDEITSKKGIDFDKAYISFMVGDHKDDIKEFTKEANDGKDAEIKAFATKGIPVLQHHLMMAKELNDRLNK